MTFEGADNLHDTARRAGQALGGVRSVDVVPPEWLHLTMTGVGFAGDFDSGAVTSIAAAVLEAAESLDVTPVVFDRLFLYGEGVCLSAECAWLQDLKALQLDLVRKAGGTAETAGDSFIPHVSLAYFSGEVDEQDLHTALDDAQLRPVEVPEPRLSLLELGRDDRVYTWRVLAQTTLRG